MGTDAIPGAAGRASVLLVDDRPDKLITLEAVLGELDVDLVKAGSGREALRCVLERDFAAILLDVNMPIMDGFETAALIRERPRSERTPIIFVTAYSEDTHAARGYSLGAVDYIVAPIIPEVLRTKVSVFVDLFNAVRQQRVHAEMLARRAARLQRLTRAAEVVMASPSTDAMLDAAMLAARDILEAEDCAARLVVGGTRQPMRWLVRTEGLLDALAPLVDGADPHAMASGAVRRTACVAATDGAARPVACMLAPLVGRDSRRLGLLAVAGHTPGAPFDDDAEALFLQLAQLTGTAIENLIFSQEHETTQLKEEFLSTLSHELRTPLTAILGWCRLLQLRRLDEDATARALGVIERNVKNQSKLIDDLLDVSRIAAGKLRLSPQPVVIRDLLEAAVENARPLAEGAGLTLHATLPEAAPEIVGDPDRLQQVVLNLLTNAVKFTPAGGRIDVRLAVRDGVVVVEVRDTGKGISRDFLPHVFERFRQADGGAARTHGGLGIGLAVVRHITQLHGGTVEAASDGEGCGAVFTITLPTGPLRQVLAVASDAGVAPGSTARVELGGVRVLVVDDEQDTRDLLREMLTRQGADVLTVGSADEALGALDSFRPMLLVSDIAMPGRDGWNLIAAVRERHTDDVLPAIALSAYAGDAERRRSRLAGFRAHLAKPVEPVELLSVVARLARREAASGPLAFRAP
jgi:signal transduction histidine kinase